MPAEAKLGVSWVEGSPLGRRALWLRGMSQGYREETRPYPEWERQRGSVRSAAAAVHQAMKLLPGPGKPETKNTTAHSDQKLFKKREQTRNPHSPSRPGGATHTRSTAVGVPPRPSTQASSAGQRLSGTSGTPPGLLHWRSQALATSPRLCAVFLSPPSSPPGKPMSSELSSAATEDTSKSLEQGSSATWGQGVETVFLHQPHPEGRGRYSTASWRLQMQRGNEAAFTCPTSDPSNLRS